MQRLEPPASRARLPLAAALFALLPGATTPWDEHTLAPAPWAAAAAAIVAGLRAVGALCEQRGDRPSR